MNLYSSQLQHVRCEQRLLQTIQTLVRRHKSTATDEMQQRDTGYHGVSQVVNDAADASGEARPALRMSCNRRLPHTAHISQSHTKLQKTRGGSAGRNAVVLPHPLARQRESNTVYCSASRQADSLLRHDEQTILCVTTNRLLTA